MTRLAPAGKRLAGEEAWGGTVLRLPAGAPAGWRNVLTGEALSVQGEQALRLAQIFRSFPVALLEPPG